MTSEISRPSEAVGIVRNCLVSKHFTLIVSLALLLPLCLRERNS